MSFDNFLYRKADECAHNEIMSFLIIILGMIMLVGGFLVTLSVVQEPEWLLFIPYQQYMNRIGTIGLILSLTGFAILALGFILVVHYDRKKSWAMNQLQKSKPDRKKVSSELQLERIRKMLQEYAAK